MLKFIVLSVLLATSAFATPLMTGFQCGSIAHPDGVVAAQERISASSVNGTQDLKAQAAVNIPVVWNVFYDQDNVKDGDISVNVITQQMNVINTYFQPMRLTFLAPTIRRFAVPYNVLHGAAQGNGVEQRLKFNHQGDAKTLNIYTVGKNPQSRFAGWSSFPWDYQKNSVNDGIVLDYNFLPGGAEAGLNTGKES
ncbi:hypothetical protein C0995_005684 [Termitomyces sp. Mi166|nr:hypothetical protein C0995_005684 [Termitomyces sp. Mi166\